MARLDILCPGLFGPFADPAAFPLQAPALARLIGRADHMSRLTGEASPDPGAVFLGAAGLTWPADESPPSAPIALLGEGWSVDPEVIWMHANPVHLRPDRDQLRLYAGAALAPQPQEVKALVAAFNRHFAPEGLELVAAAPERWYLCLRHRPLQLEMAPLPVVQGRSLSGYLPQGQDAVIWMRLLTEAQMLFHAHPVNQRRAALGRPSLNGLWTWGQGRLPTAFTPTADELIGDLPLVKGLAQLGGCAYRTLDDWLADPATGPQRRMVFWDRHWRASVDQDLGSWQAATRALDDALARLWKIMARRQLASLTLDPCQGPLFRLKPHHRWRLWRRPSLGAGLWGKKGS
ncbi:phosphoglycerate mutase [Caldichromatium japonicum]|uniref:Phosphoglycerate mutase n=1 Tax=Caldichromatium japonicum TaxID=2699430 RepID=A0A6G7V9Y0_9GAMM|nr:phosphoglycerate mutase [Caldichromatium japonicum]QIK36869.1 phosphoglycerate mutase [Caldichromatium japonicum]